MNAMEKMAWTELLVSVTTLLIVSALIPFWGNAASGAFGLLGLLVTGLWFVRGRGDTVIVDERDREIERLAIIRGVGAAWMLLFLSLIGIVLWSSFFNDTVVDVWMLSWIIWLQFATCYLVKGLVAVHAYWRQRHAA
ncbi:hypothetical protein DTL42_15155 [Bremerella cremea]|uniref:DUF2178 domain-containing protein n=1 Tax=Bremerella cremea TaxID=1031537 RepID=A0A368KP15_9BACT|nr:hypothetical protein [Bremerella cremea]RCS46307.1 hypothetical protein DTL42_15155 [Bremerella cremea]